MYGRVTRAGKPDVFAKGRFLALDGNTKWVKYRTFNIDGMA